ncbi:tryptophanyl-tRNA synthetase [Halobacteroides halobius DSM 5150]|uniref:Tryptophan--tRNA ligase n=1 Tax=Halobacteroides halobius (strain ATCC 35273 / DSM 5150 / MD-1) TaxID=748449 RepID=L0K6C5_HALHC|nr:tryptophan--tRNA ligase [Halobacteroides halobius]AGB40581.1 tryptophanyl-tRNA synthetase [Halobacteroides halobius DSM 5150]
MSNKGTILSGSRPTGKLHLGHLIGVLDNWKDLQEDYDCIFEVADWHALTTKYDQTENIKQHIREMVADWIGAGIDPRKSTLFIQSDVPEIAELHLLLSMIVSVGRLERNPTYKEQIQELGDNDSIPFGLLEYPVLQAADILFAKADTVPVGEDQLPHIEITRDIARRFNYLYEEVFPEPESKLAKVPRLPGLDGRKMSKSYGNAIYLSDSKDEINDKVNQMVTDPERIRLSDPGNPDVCSVYDFHEIFNKEEAEDIAAECRSADLGCVDCKNRLANVLNNELAGIRNKREELLANPKQIDEILAKGTQKVRKQAKETLKEVRAAMNLK